MSDVRDIMSVHVVECRGEDGALWYTRFWGEKVRCLTVVDNFTTSVSEEVT